MPTAFKEGKEANGTWHLKCRDPKIFKADVAEVYRKTRHKAIPAWIQDIKYKAATETDLVGERFFLGERASRAICKRCGLIESTAHKFRRCGEVQLAWKTQLQRSEAMSGQVCSSTDEWITGWGWRLAENAGEDTLAYSKDHEEIFQVMHASTVAAIHIEHAKAAPGKAHTIVEQADRLAKSIIDDRRRNMAHKKFVDTYVGIGLIEWADRKERNWKWAHRQPYRNHEVEIEAEKELYTDGTRGESDMGSRGGYGWVEVTGDEETVATDLSP
jgi:ribosomal protein L40E